MTVAEPSADSNTADRPILLGPFLGQVTSTSIKVWLHLEAGPAEVFVSVHPARQPGSLSGDGTLRFDSDNHWTDCIIIAGLDPDTRYEYRLWTNPAHSIPLDLQGLNRDLLTFQTLPSDPNERIDFVVMSCHNPFESGDDGYEGHAIWADMRQIIGHENNRYVRFAVLVGDQVYADEFKDELLAEEDDDKRFRIYMKAYRKFWSNLLYRQVMCSLPSVMIWDDHEIIDGWGSDVASFVGSSSQFKPEWARLLESASSAFSVMQACRNPAPLADNGEGAFDVGFRAGRLGFMLLDVRSNRNVRLGRVLSEDQFARIKDWIRSNRSEIDLLFVVSPVVFSHGPGIIERLATRWWKVVLTGAEWLARSSSWGRGMYASFHKSVGDIRDDVRDAWSSEDNASQADLVLNELFALQNDPEAKVPVVVLSGDIHTSGYATLYSKEERHANQPTIPHITSSSVSYKPFNWILEAIYRHASKTVRIGKQGSYHAQVSHHFCARSVAVLSVRPVGDGERQLKVKYYLEGYPEPQILLFDLARNSHRENIGWIADAKVYPHEFSPSPGADMERFLMENDVASLLEERASAHPERLNYQESIVDLLKLLDQDSSLGARKELAKELGYRGVPDGSAEMNIWLHQEVIRRFIRTESRANGAAQNSAR